jgi:hypothetical protein
MRYRIRTLLIVSTMMAIFVVGIARFREAYRRSRCATYPGSEPVRFLWIPLPQNIVHDRGGARHNFVDPNNAPL